LKSNIVCNPEFFLKRDFNPEVLKKDCENIEVILVILSIHMVKAGSVVVN
jgi:hypothetical protein